MADFQSFLFQNMQMIGLEEEEDPECKVSKSSGSCASSHSSQSMTKRQPDGKIFKAFGSISGSTTETYLSNSHRKHHGATKTAEPDPYDLNSQQPNFPKKKLAHSSCESFPEPPAESEHFFAKKDQMFESKVMDLDMNYVMGDDEPKSDSKSLSSPESNLKFNFKSSSPIIAVQETKYDSSSQSERQVKSPKAPRRKKSLNYRKFSPCRSIFDKKTMSKASLNSFNEDESFAKSNYRLNSNYIVSSMIFDRKKLNMAHKSNTSSESDLDANSSLESLLMEPYLVKFEEELIKNSKCEIIKDLSNLNHSLTLADQQTSARGQKNLFQKYFSEIKNLTLKKKSSPLKKPLDAELFTKVDQAEELVYDEQDEEEDQEEMLTNSPLDKDNLKLVSKAHIPWQSLDVESCDQLLDMVIGNLNQTVGSEQFPPMFSKKGNRISKNQVKRWFDLLEKLAQGEVSKCEEAEPAKSRLYSSKQFLINKKRQFMEKVSKKKCKTTPHLDVSGSGSDISKTASKLYANVMPHEAKRSCADAGARQEKKKEANYENESFVSKKKSPRKLNADHFYNEITDLEQRQAAIKHKNRQKERVERSAPSRNLSQKNTEILQQIYDYTQESSHDSTSNLIFKRNIAAIAKLKSPERKILYNEWFTILKRMEKDPKFDLETLVRTRGRFTDNDKISYRTKLMEKGDKIRTARSEPNFSTMFSNPSRVGRTRNGVNTTPAVKAHRELDPVGSKSNPNPKAAKAEPNALKLTLEKSDINKIKNLLKKKDKSLKIDLTNLKERTNMRKMQHKAELASQKQQKQLLATHAIISEEFDEDDQDNLKISLNSQINKRTTSSSSKLKKNRSRNLSSMDESNIVGDQAPDEADTASTNQKHESKLISRCKKMYTSSETAKALTEVTKMVRGLKIGNKLKNFTNSSSKFINKAIHHGNEDQDESIGSDRPSNHRKKASSKAINSETGSQASMTFSSSNMSEEEVPKRPHRRSEHHSEERDKRSSSRHAEKKSRSKDRTSAKVPSSPARPPPPKRPPPPRPFSPATSCSSISTNVKKSSRHRDFEDESFSVSPSKRSTHLPPRPKPPSNLPPRPPKSKHRNEESFDDESINDERHRRHKSDRHDDKLKHKRNTSSGSRQDPKDHKEARRNAPRNSTPVRSPNMSRELKSKSNARREVCRR